MSFHEKIRGDLIRILDREETDKISQLNNSMRLLAKWRSVLIQNTVLQHEGKIVLGGPFRGMEFLEHSSEGCHVAKLLGCYEQPLFSHIENAISDEFDLVINIGCAEGYYAVGMAMRMPNSKILAFDTNKDAQAACLKLAAANKVSERIQIGGTFNSEDFNSYKDKRTLLLCDIEGAENELLDPQRADELTNIFMIVESHECVRPGVTDILTKRFSPTHNVIQVDDSGSRNIIGAPQWFDKLSHLDQLLATWEWRSGPTPWLVMEPKRK
jgi:hypothetical protein